MPRNQLGRFTKTSNSYQEQYTKKALSTLKELVKKIERGEFSVENFGWWQEGTHDKYTFQIHVKD